MAERAANDRPRAEDPEAQMLGQLPTSKCCHCVVKGYGHNAKPVRDEGRGV